jgi:hypothetical protein
MNFSYKGFNEATNATHAATLLYSFLHSFFPLGFWKEFLTRHELVAVFAQGGVL